MSCKNISVIGAGYVGISNALLLARRNAVTIFDISPERAALLRRRVSPIRDPDVEACLRDPAVSLTVAADEREAFAAPDFVIIATPTDYDPDKDFFNTASVESVIASAARLSPRAAVVIKSTVPVGFTERMKKRHAGLNLLFSPEFLREGQALRDNLYPSRIIVGGAGDAAREFAALLAESAQRADAPVLFMHPTEAEAVKLFANTFLALRVAFFNELDTYAEARGLDAKSIVDGVCRDPRIGDYYNNPSFGYGGYCLPKDTRQLKANYRGIPNNLITAVIEANRTRKDYIAGEIAARAPRRVGIYRLAMKAGSDNARSSAMLGIVRRLKERGLDVVIYDPAAAGDEAAGCPVERDFAAFAASADLIVANRLSEELLPVRNKVYTRDIFARD